MPGPTVLLIAAAAVLLALPAQASRHAAAADQELSVFGAEAGAEAERQREAAAEGQKSSSSSGANSSQAARTRAGLIELYGRISPDSVLAGLGGGKTDLQLLSQGVCPRQIGSSEVTLGLGCKLGCECTNSWMKTCYEGECGVSDMAGVAMGGKVPKECIAWAVGRCKIATWVYVAAGVLALLVVVGILLCLRRKS